MRKREREQEDELEGEVACKAFGERVEEDRVVVSSETQRKDGTVSTTSSKKARKLKKIPKQHRVGNFRSYYNYRLGQQHVGALEEDPRLSIMEAVWFQGRRGLDIGCNTGNMTVGIAKKFSPSFILGIDVDPQLIAQARKHLKELIQQQQVKSAFDAVCKGENHDNHPIEKREENDTRHDDSSERHQSDSDATEASVATTLPTEQATDSTPSTKGAFTDQMPLSFQLWKPPVSTTQAVPAGVGKAALGSDFPYTVVFKREDIVKDTHAGKDYDFITCLSVSKWIHLFHGDAGIRSLFQKCFDLLRPGGHLILEPQPWKSYHKRKFTTFETAANYAQIELRPKDFPTFLVETIGFKSCSFLQVCQTSVNGFRRPMYVVEK